MVEFLFGLVILGAVLAAALVAPVLSLLSASRARKTAADALERIGTLEARIARLETTLRPAAAEPAASPQPPPRPRVERAAPITSPPSPSPQGGLEEQIGGRWLLYVGLAAVILGVSYFVKFAFDNGWISEPLRVLAAVAAGVGLVAAGLRFASRGLALFGQALAGGGIVVLYLATYAALHFYSLISAPAAFAAMVLTTLVGVVLAERQSSQPLAMLALVGGFATPLLVGGERGAQLVLFTYLAVLVAGGALFARRRQWPLVGAVAYVGTFTIVVAWAFSSYAPGAWLRTHLFLTLYVALFAWMLRQLLVSSDRSPQAQWAIAALATAPLVYHGASMMLLTAHAAAWLVYVVAVTTIALGASRQARAPWIRLVVLFIVSGPAMAWLVGLATPAWWTPGVVVAAVLYFLHLVAEWDGAEQSADALPFIEAAATHLNGLLLPATLYLFFEDKALWVNPGMLAGLAGWNVVLAAAARGWRPPLSVHHAALAATLAAAAWVVAFDGPVVAAGWVAEGVFVGWVALRERSQGLGAIAGVMAAVGAVLMARTLVQAPEANAAAFLNPRAFAAALAVALLAWLAVRMRDDGSAWVSGAGRDQVILLANVLAIVLISVEVRTFFDAAGAGWTAQVALSVVWALYAVGLVAVGILRRYTPARYLAIALFAVTLLKVFAYDLAALGRVERMFSVLLVGLLLLAASYLYQRTAAARQAQRP